MEELAKILYETEWFSSAQGSLDFVRTKALKRIEGIVRLSLRLEHVFMVDVTSSDMTLLFATPGTVFDGMEMDRDGDLRRASAPGSEDKIAGTTEVGVRRSVRTGPGQSRRDEVLLRTKVVLERDVVVDEK